MPLYALNLFDLAENEQYLRYSRRSPGAVAKHGGRVVALGRLDDALAGDAGPRSVMILVEWPSREAFQAFLDDSELRTCTRCGRRGRVITCGGPTSAWRTCARSSPAPPEYQDPRSPVAPVTRAG
jgi:uncharacterized protein (DUF1330 family)